MRYVLENEILRAEIDSFGAELKSVVKKETSQEYMWEANPAYWGKTSPILFPFIGKLEGGEYLHEGKRYEAAKHGFARDMDFAVAEQTADAITFYTENNEETMKNFPFAFRLELIYRLQGNVVEESLRVFNKDGETMYFSIGGHPALACPPKSGKPAAGKLRTDCSIKLYGADNQPFAEKQVVSTAVDVREGLLTGASFPVELQDAQIPVTETLFDIDTLILEEQGVHAVALCDAAGREYVRVEAETPVWGIWTMPQKEASYICLEPWWGVCDAKGYAGSLQERPHTNSVAAGEVWEQGFRMVML